MGMILDFLNFLLGLTVFVGIALIVVVVLMKKGKIKIRKNESEVDYTQIRRKDSRDYVKFDAIIGANEYTNTRADDGIIVLDNGRRFVAGIEVKGFNFYNASAESQASTIGGMRKFIDILKSPIQYRQSTKKVDLTEKISYYEHKELLLLEEIDDLQVQLFQVLQKKERYVNDEEAQEIYSENIESIQREITAKNWLLNECRTCHSYLTAQTNIGALERYQCYFYEWVFDPIMYSANDLSREEIYEMAIGELENTGNIYIDSLRNCSVYGHRLSKKEIIGEMRSHNKPLSARDYPFEYFWENIHTKMVTSDD